MSTVPQVRGVFAKFLVRAIKREPEPLGSLLRAALPDALRAQVRQGTRMDWYPASVLAELAQLLVTVGGEAGAEQVWKTFFIESIDFPLVRPLATSAVRLFGANPGALVRRTPQAWELVTRHCADMQAGKVSEDGRIEFTVDALTPVLRTRAMLPMFQGGFAAQMTFLDATGQVRLSTEALPGGHLVFEITW